MPSYEATWTIVGNFDARSGLGRFETQLFAPNVQAALRRIMSGQIIRKKLDRAPDGWPRRFTMGDIDSLLSFNRLPNVYLCQLVRNRNYLTLSIRRDAVNEKSTHPVRKRMHGKTTRRTTSRLAATAVRSEAIFGITWDTFWPTTQAPAVLS